MEERWLKLRGQGWVPACRGAVMGWETLATPSDEQQVDLLSLEVIKKPAAACPPGDQADPRQRDG